jgi:hypothetical protein
VDATERCVSERQCIKFDNIWTYRLRCGCHRKMYDASDDASNSMRSGLTLYGVDAAERCVSKRRWIEFDEIWTYRLWWWCHGKMYQLEIYISISVIYALTYYRVHPTTRMSVRTPENRPNYNLTSYIVRAIRYRISK